jgi:hypothetical protein
VATGVTEAVGEGKNVEPSSLRGTRKQRIGQANGVEGRRFFLGKPGENHSVPEFSHGLISNEHFTREMFRECHLVNRIHAEELGKLINEKQALDEALGKAEYRAKRNDQAARSDAGARRNASRSAWCQALHTVICAGKGMGSLLFHAFPQEIIDKVAEDTGSIPVQASVPDLVDGEIEFDEDGHVFLVEQFPNGGGTSNERKIFLVQILKKGEVLVDGRIVVGVQPFPMRYGSGVIRDRKLVLNGIRRCPTAKGQSVNYCQPCESSKNGGNTFPYARRTPT